MAWTNFAIDFPTCENTNESYWSNLIAQTWTQWANYSAYLGTANPLSYEMLNTTRWIWGDLTCGCKYTYTNDYLANFTFYYNNEVYLSMTCEPARVNQSGNALYFYCGVDETNQYGSIFMMYKSGNQCINRNLGYSKNDWQHTMYLIIKAGALITYQWSSVPAISGKNGILSLTTLKEESINDGSPVDDATASAFNNAPNSCSVGGIVSVDLPIVDDNPLSIAVKYNIPELTDSVYSSCKVVAKKNKIPKSKTDGDKILDVSPSSHGCVIKGLEQETKYYVVVFVEDSFGNKAESEPGGPVRTGKQSGIFKMRMTTSQGIRDGGFKETITITQQ